MRKIETTDGVVLREMFSTATAWLEKSVADIDALNVFPVPDGDTGTNMLLTMRSAVEEAYRAPDHSATAVAQAMSKGALMGARGNSGVILSQIWRGMAQGMGKKETFTGKDFADAFLPLCYHILRVTVFKEGDRRSQPAGCHPHAVDIFNIFTLQYAINLNK